MKRLLRTLRNVAGRVHRDERGAVSVLVLLTIWCLVALLGLAWNTTEEGRSRQAVQTAADAAAQSAATWMARSVNMVAAQNMIICEDASAEALARAVGPTYRKVKQELDREVALVAQMQGQNPLVPVARSMDRPRAGLAAEYELADRALQQIFAYQADDEFFADKQEKDNFRVQSDGARQTLDGANQILISEIDPILANLKVAQLLLQVNNTILDRVLRTIRENEIPYNEAFRERTAPADSPAVIAHLQEHQGQVWADQQAVVSGVGAAVEETRRQLSDYYKADLTLATLATTDNSGGAGGGTADPSRVQAPLMPASAVASQGQADTIRTDPRYRQSAVDLGMPLTVTIDPINPHTWDHEPGVIGDHAYDNRIWFPNLRAYVPAGLQQAYPRVRNWYAVQCMPSNETGWGEQWATPLERYFLDRSGRDSGTLGEEYLGPIDRARADLGAWIQEQIRTVLGIDTLELDRIERELPMPVTLTAPSKADANFRAQVALYNQHSGAFLGGIRGLLQTLRTYTSIYAVFTNGFAVDRWYTERNFARRVVIRNLGNGKQFMITASYVLRPIPAWAQETMRVSVFTTVQDAITSLNMVPLTTDLMLSGMPPGEAALLADNLVRPVATEAALAITNEWMNRPWPYEFTPPETVVPPSRGIPEGDRKRYFTVVAGARQMPGTGPKLLLPSMFGTDQTTLAAYAQGEMHNWYEFDGGYGGGERFDQVVRTPWTYVRFAQYGSIIANPRHWRVSTAAGWNWRARLTLSDALPEAAALSPELARYLQDAGIGRVDAAAFKVLNLH